MKELQDTAVASADRPPAPPVPSALDPLAFARWWVQERGLSVIALDHPHAPVASQAHQIGKVPVASWKAFHACQPTDGNLRVWFGIGTPRNKGIGTGAISDGVAVGCDSLEADEWARGTPPNSHHNRRRFSAHRLWLSRVPTAPLASRSGAPKEGCT